MLQVNSVGFFFGRGFWWWLSLLDTVNLCEMYIYIYKIAPK